MSQSALSPVSFSLVAARLAQTAAILGILGTALFLGAGRLDWWEAWVILAVYSAAITPSPPAPTVTFAIRCM